LFSYFVYLYCGNVECTSTEFRCSDGSCIYHEHVCDGFTDCPDLSDESDDVCGKNYDLCFIVVPHRPMTTISYY